MIKDYHVWPFEPHSKPSGASLYGMIIQAQRNHLTEFKYYEDGKEVIVKVEKMSSRTPEMMY